MASSSPASCGLLLSALVLGGCATGGAADLDARFEAGWRPSRGYCLFGAETARLAAWCADVNFGRDGLLAVARAVNQQVLGRAAGQPLPCMEHVAEARRRLAEYPDYTLAEIYSCDAEPPLEAGRPVCHVSLLVTGPSGVRVVMDNGYVLQPAATGGVAFYPRFVAQVDRHWIGERPDWVALAAAGRRSR
jgi:hypothetical protein